MTQKDITLRIKTVETELKQSLKKIERLEKTIDKLNNKNLKPKTSAAQKAFEKLNKEIEKGNKIVDKLFDTGRSTGFGNSIGKVRDQLSSVRKAFDATSKASERTRKATALIAGNFKKIRMEAVAFAQASGNTEAIKGAMGGSVQTRLKEIQQFPKTMLAGREAMKLLNAMLELAEVNSKDFLDISKAIGRQLQQNADIQKAADLASGKGNKKSGNAASKEKLKDEQKVTEEMRRQKKIEDERFKKALRNIRQRKKDRKQQRQGRLLGAGFPLLFGGGVGSVAGSLAGSFAAKPGEEFGAQIFGSAIGSQLEQLVRRANSLGDAIREISFEKLEEQGIIVNGQLQAQINLLNEIGQKEQARALIAEEVRKRTGATADVNKDINRSVQLLNAGFSELVNSAGTTLAILGAPLLGAVGALSGGVAVFFKGFNTLASGVRKLIPDLPIVDKFFKKFDKSLQKAAANSKEIQKNMKKLSGRDFTELSILDEKIIGKQAQTFEAQRKNLELDKKLLRMKNRNRLQDELIQQKISKESDSEAFDAIKQRFDDALNLEIKPLDDKLFIINQQENLRNAKITRRIDLLNHENDIKEKIIAAEKIGDDSTAKRLQHELNRVSIQSELGEKLRDAKSTEHEILLVQEAITKLKKLDLDFTRGIIKEQKALKDQATKIVENIEKDNELREFSLTASEQDIAFKKIMLSLDEKILDVVDKTRLRQALADSERIDALERQKEILDEIKLTLATEMSTAIKGLITGANSLNDTFRNILNKMADAFFNMALFGNVGGSLTKGGGLLGTIFGGLLDAGGPAKGGKSYIVGEKGPEMFTPGVSGMVTPNNALGGSTNIVVNVDASGSSVEDDEASSSQLGKLIGLAVQQELVKQSRAGGLLSRA